jgi:flagellar hook-associated protein 3 FlgL
MRISDAQMYRLASSRIMDSKSASTAAGDEVSTGRRVTHPWDDPAAAGMISRHADQQAREVAIADATGKASDELVAVDGALDQVTTSLTRAHELAIQLSNDTYSAADRANAATEVGQLFSAVVSQLNLRFGDRYVFGGMLDGAPPFSAAGAYLGDANVRQVEIAPGIMQDASLRADQAVKGVGGGVDVLTELTNLQAALSTNNSTNVRAAVQSLDDGIKQLSNLRSHGGAMMNVFDLAGNTARSFGNSAQDARGKLEDADFFDSSTRYAAAQRALDASMSVAVQQFKLTLLDKL